jgi:hypothetical protein
MPCVIRNSLPEEILRIRSWMFLFVAVVFTVIIAS